jgi:flavin reductase (DIM6/NTAB) family NADH-FMN oxidoreductase RutF
VKRLLGLLRHGQGLRHLPVVYSAFAANPLRLTFSGLRGGPVDVSRDHCPVSLRPLILGLRLPETIVQPPSQLTLEISEANAKPITLARIELGLQGTVPLMKDSLHLFRTTRSWNRTAPPIARWVRYVLAWQHARDAVRRGDRLLMSAADLRALNAYYISARPVYLVGVSHDKLVNLFPMDLVAPLGSGDFVLALRATSPAIDVIEASRRIAMSGAPAAYMRAIYELGAQHRRTTIDLDALGFSVTRSRLFGLPVLAGAGLVRELSVQTLHRIGSHVLFVCRVEEEQGHTETQLAHVSAMYAERLTRMKQPYQALTDT